MKLHLVCPKVSVYCFLLLLFGIAVTQAQQNNTATYICPMYCTDETSTTEGATCSVCTMELQDKAVVENPTTHKLIFPQEAYDLISKGTDVLVLDVRRQSEYDGSEGHLSDAVLIPIAELDYRLKELEPHKKKTIIAYCSHGVRSARAAQLLSKRGFTVFSLVGGTTKWKRERYPIILE